MTSTYHEVAQRSPEWHALRLGRLTGSNFNLLMGNKTPTRAKYIQERAIERYMNYPVASSNFESWQMRRGSELEPNAFDAYRRNTWNEVRAVGFVTREDIPLVGVSPDGLVAQEGAIEVKCPMNITHYRYLKEQIVPVDYWWQCIGVLLFCHREWIDFVSYCPGMPTFIKRIDRNTVIDDIYRLKEGLFEAHRECQEVVDNLVQFESIYGPEPIIEDEYGY